MILNSKYINNAENFLVKYKYVYEGKHRLSLQTHTYQKDGTWQTSERMALTKKGTTSTNTKSIIFRWRAKGDAQRQKML